MVRKLLRLAGRPEVPVYVRIEPIAIEPLGNVALAVPLIDAEGNNPVWVALDVDVARAEEFIVSRIAGA